MKDQHTTYLLLLRHFDKKTIRLSEHYRQLYDVVARYIPAHASIVAYFRRILRLTFLPRVYATLKI